MRREQQCARGLRQVRLRRPAGAQPQQPPRRRPQEAQRRHRRVLTASLGAIWDLWAAVFVVQPRHRVAGPVSAGGTTHRAAALRALLLRSYAKHSCAALRATLSFSASWRPPGAAMRRWRQLGSAHMEAAQASGRPQPHLTPGLAAPLADVGLSLSLDERAAAHWLIHEQAAPTFAAGGTAPGGMRVGAPEEAPGMRDTPWRCLDKTHAASCNRCDAVRRGLGWSGSFCLHF